jgi:tRNA 5-methylaminomethyl-2-thiouridine biosynthesis bifunctional protein
VKTQPVVPARLVFGDDGAWQTPDFGDPALAPDAALAQARTVFLAGNDLPARWAGREGFVVLATGFGVGHTFLAFWDAWQRDPQRCRQLVFVAIEPHPPRYDDLARAHRASALPVLAQALLAAWPPLTPNLHLLDFDGGQVRLLLGLGDIAALLPELSLQADAFCLHGAAPSRAALPWHHRVVPALGRRAAVGATLASDGIAAGLRAQLVTAAFHAEAMADGNSPPGATRAWHRPRHTAPAAVPPSRREAVVVGAGLAGAAVARALADEGWQVSVFDRHATPASEASGNAGGLFHGTVHAYDGPHARLLRAAALHAEHTLRPCIERGAMPGQLQGLLRLDTRPVAAMQALITQQGLPAEWVQALAPQAASAAAGVAIAGAAWFYPGGGWVSPAG